MFGCVHSGGSGNFESLMLCISLTSKGVVGSGISEQ